MCNFSAGYFDRGHAEGMEKGMEKGFEKSLVGSIRALMETLSLTAEQAMDALRVPAEERPKYLELLAQ